MIKHGIREQARPRPVASSTGSADLALLRAALGLLADAEVRWSTCR